ncbi:hypothetical protein GUJ93_ZPchr0007g3146 [Zizania palustris]|uniref:DUF4220 domain-containing protein n=1 Tax=Zizania palustris TaxID=103762 RepID=A0A8J5VUD2_ZIZPA|nr:hypothetical protein GUJ93_ZPchr0007g3146 [Zizania palustris]
MLYVRPKILDDIVFIQSKRLSCSSRKSKSNKARGDVDDRNSNTKSNYDKKIEQCRYRGEGILKHDGEGILKHNNLRNEIQMQLKSREVRDVPVDKQDLLDVVLLGSIQNRDFDESLLMWHIANDLSGDAVGDGRHWPAPLPRHVRRGTALLSIGGGVEARTGRRPDDAALEVNKSREPAEVKGDRSKSVLFDACILAKVLRNLQDATMWKVVAGVWREMLTYAVGKCLGSTHVEQLSCGGELITMVWFLFLMAHMGIGDMYQIKQGDAKAKLIVHDQ